MKGDSRRPTDFDGSGGPTSGHDLPLDEKYRMIFRESPVGLVTADRDFFFTEANPAFCRMTGYTEQELKSLTFRNITHPDYRECDTEQINKLLHGEIKIYQTEKRYLRKDGELVWGHLSSRVVLDSDGNFLYFLSMVEDVTERKRIEHKLLESEEKYRHIFDNAVLGIFQSTPEGRYITVNPAFARRVGYASPEEMIADVRDIRTLYVNPDDRTRLRHLMETEGMVRGFEAEINNKDGRRHWISISAKAVKDDRGRILYYDGITEDITARKKMEAALRESEERFRNLFETSPDSTFLIDQETGNFIDANPVACGLYGYTRNEFLRMKHTDISAEPKKTKAAVQESLTSVPLRFHRKKDGTVFPVEIAGSNFKLGDRAMHTAIIRDISERMRVEEILRESEQRYRMLFENAHDGFALADLDTGTLLDCNEALCRMVGRGRAELVGQPQSILHPPLDLVDGLSPSFHQHRREGPAPTLEERLLSASGKLIAVEISAAHMRMNGRRLLLGVFRDITDRKRHEEELIIKNNAINSAISSIAFYDLDGRITYANSAAVSLWGYSDEKEILGRKITDFFAGEKEPRDILSGILLGKAWAGKVKARKKDGFLFDVQASANLVRDVGGNPVCVMGSAVDVTEQEHMREVVMRSEKISALEKLSAGLAHELRNPLAVISSCAQLSLETIKLPGRLEKNLQMIYRNSQRASHLINELLTFARPSQLTHRPLDINEILSRTIRMAALEKPVDYISFETVFDPYLPKVLGDGEKIGQVFLNILSNAIEALPQEGKVRLESRWLMAEGVAEVSISDNGPGIPEEIRTRLFDPFFTTKANGTGLGLSLSNSIVQQHQGRIDVQGRPEGGTVVSVRLPVMQNADADRTRPGVGKPAVRKKRRGKK